MYNFFLNQKAKLTKAINAGTSTNGPITPANACPLLIPNTPMALYAKGPGATVGASPPAKNAWASGVFK